MYMRLWSLSLPFSFIYPGILCLSLTHYWSPCALHRTEWINKGTARGLTYANMMIAQHTRSWLLVISFETWLKDVTVTFGKMNNTITALQTLRFTQWEDLSPWRQKIPADLTHSILVDLPFRRHVDGPCWWVEEDLLPPTILIPPFQLLQYP